ncbi:MAG: 30S ribosomal protein S7 [Candidatus Aenigmarchaeota archaeon]|nr:30S ribosomal protein S7 [Candidatus Aenigmarchaeota archaeon]
MTTEIKLFNKWSFDELKITDEGLVQYITIKPQLVPKSGGQHAKKQFHKSKVNIVERLVNKLFVAGHKGKKHKFSSGTNVGKSFMIMKGVEDAFIKIEENTKENPIQVLITAIENSAPMEEVVTYQRGGSFARNAVITSPQRRIDLALKHIAQGTYQTTTKAKKTLAQALSEQIIGTSKNDTNLLSIREKQRREKEAAGAR